MLTTVVKVSKKREGVAWELSRLPIVHEKVEIDRGDGERRIRIFGNVSRGGETGCHGTSSSILFCSGEVLACDGDRSGDVTFPRLVGLLLPVRFSVGGLAVFAGP